MNSSAAAFLTAHGMHPDRLSLPTLVESFLDEMDRGLRGERSSLGMFPAYLRSSGVPRTNTPVLVIDAGGTNLRAARLRMGADGRFVTEDIRRGPMPGTRGELEAAEMFEAMARLALEVSEGCTLACISFSYPCEVLPGGDGRMLRLTKELHVRSLEGSLICRPLEEAMQALGAPGVRRWRLINDTVGSLLGGMAEGCRELYDDHIGFILGTGTNCCCNVRAERILKSPEAMAMGGDVVVNLESGGFDKLPQGTADKRLDAASEKPGAQRAEKMIAGGYFPALLQTTLLLAGEEGLLSPAAAAKLAGANITGRDVDALCRDAGENDLFQALLGAERPFARAVNELLLERAARITAGILSGILTHRSLPRGARVCVCADGTTFRKNPLLGPRTQYWLTELVTKPQGVSADFFQVSDATLLGSGYAGLLL